MAAIGEKVIDGLANRILDLEDANPRFVDIKDVDTDKVVKDMKNVNTKRMTECHVKVFQQFLVRHKEFRPMHEIEPAGLDKYLARFYLSVRKTNGSEYEPGTLSAMTCSINRHLKDMSYKVNIMSSSEFDHSREVLVARKKQLKEMGLGNQSRKSEALSEDDIGRLYEQGLLGTGNPQAILNTMWLNMTTHFGLRGRQEHVSMLWGDVELRETNDGQRYLEFNERVTKTRTGQKGNIRGFHPKMFELPGNNRCPVNVYLEYRKRRPEEENKPDSRFYLQPTPGTKPIWFKKQPLGKNSIGNICKAMADAAGLQGRKTNHSARKTTVQTLKDGGMSDNDIAKITGHKNNRSLQAYYEPSMLQQQKMSHALSKATAPDMKENEPLLVPETKETVDPPLDPEMWSADMVLETLKQVEMYEQQPSNNGTAAPLPTAPYTAAVPITTPDATAAPLPTAPYTVAVPITTSDATATLGSQPAPSTAPCALPMGPGVTAGQIWPASMQFNSSHSSSFLPLHMFHNNHISGSITINIGSSSSPKRQKME